MKIQLTELNVQDFAEFGKGSLVYSIKDKMILCHGFYDEDKDKQYIITVNFFGLPEFTQTEKKLEELSKLWEKGSDVMLVSCQQNIDKVINGVHFYTIDNPEHEILITSFSRKGELIVIKASKVKRRLEKLEELAKYYGFNNYNEFIVESIKNYKPHSW